MGTELLTVGEAGESRVLERVLLELGSADATVVGPGDDCAVLRTHGDIAVTTDTMVEGPDFRLAWQSPFEIGWKLAATNLSDVAAMGAKPTALTVAFACPGTTPVARLAGIAAGLNAACKTLAPGCNVVGGDLANAPVLFAAVTALGDLEDRAHVTRSGARAGDQVAYSGHLGLAALGLEQLFTHATNERGEADSAQIAELWSAHPEALAAQLAPSPPIPLGIVAAEHGATAMIDVSDSLSLDASRIANASGVSIDLDTDELLTSFGTQAGVPVPLERMLTGGEDHGLLATFPSDTPLPHGFHRIGSVNTVKQQALLLDGEAFQPTGWDPFTQKTHTIVCES